MWIAEQVKQPVYILSPWQHIDHITNHCPGDCLDPLTTHNDSELTVFAMEPALICDFGLLS